MSKAELIERLGKPTNGKSVEVLSALAETCSIGNEDSVFFTVGDVLEVTMYSKKEVAFRAAWMLEYIFLNQGVGLATLQQFLKQFPLQRNQSVIRHYGKIMAYLTGKKVKEPLRQAVAHIDFEPIIETLFGWLIDDEVLVANKVHAMQALANLAGEYRWIKDELLETIDHLVDKESIAFFARAKQIRRTLQKIKP